MSTYPKKKFLLFKKSQHFCSAPWNLLYIGTNGDISTCTRGKFSSSAYETPVEQILTGDDFQQIKTEILNDKISQNCKECIGLENHGDNQNRYQHLRNMYNELFVDQSVDYTNTKNFQLGALDLHWSSICDLKCITCWAKQSSSIANEQNLPIQHLKTETALKIIDFITENQSTLKEVYLSGGEPTLIKYNLNLLRKLQKRSDLLIRVNSNMMWGQDNQIVQEILKFPRVMFTCSADNIGQKFEYIRRGASWNKFIDNLKYLMTFPNVEIRVNSVFFVLNAVDLSDTINYFYAHHGIENFTINQCGMGHTYYRCRNLSQPLKLVARQKLNAVREDFGHNLNLVGSINNCLKELDYERTESYVSALEQIDSIAGTNWKTVFPELI